MELYKVIFSHTAPKDSKIGIETYLLAKGEKEVYKWIDKEYNSNYWKSQNDEGEALEVYNDEYELIGTETFEEKIIRIKGEINDEDYDYSDAYYGITLHGWELVKENIKKENYTEMIDLGLIKVA